MRSPRWKRAAMRPPHTVPSSSVFELLPGEAPGFSISHTPIISSTQVGRRARHAPRGAAAGAVPLPALRGSAAKRR